ncbi:uncharacterized protein CLUP02_12094 [Colletotrichum lupini]|uniref:Uncharacterized protein n=1 Tax=Colletotrichum lupini TaxID=145971 RepID=A0A9Q8SZX7_9PEZI|nr:uncharacterized protein CLUP02_12094 [Colletotrichum lupini]UQC86592.1 hypothetical protein CLUP02_12094 [Colletotrichum lupini]
MASDDRPIMQICTHTFVAWAHTICQLGRTLKECLQFVHTPRVAQWKTDELAQVPSKITVLVMGISTEAVIAIVALFIALPPIIFKVLQWMHREQRRSELPAPVVSALAQYQTPWIPDSDASHELFALTPLEFDRSTTNASESFSRTRVMMEYTRVTARSPSARYLRIPTLGKWKQPFGAAPHLDGTVGRNIRTKAKTSIARYDHRNTAFQAFGYC